MNTYSFYFAKNHLLNMEKNIQPSDLELEILHILWESEPCTVRFIHEIINRKRTVGYTTILKQMQRMHDGKKKLVTRYKVGKVHYYSAVPKESEMQKSLVKQFLKTAYNGAAMKLVMHALGQTPTTEKELDAIQEWLNNQKKQNNDE